MTSRVAMGKVRLVLFDAFDTLITPRLPIHVQYAEEAHKAGLTSIDPEAVRSGFRKAFKIVSTLHPAWGRNSDPPLSPEGWWTELIEECMVQAGAEKDQLKTAMPFLGPSLLRRFESREGYKAFDDVIPTLTALKELNVLTGVVSNADSRILKTLSSLQIQPLLTAPSTLSYCCGVEKPDRRIFELACERAGVERGASQGDDKSVESEKGKFDGVIMVGDELEADYQGALSAGLEARLIRRPGEWSDGAKRSSETEEELISKGVRVVRGLEELVEEVRERNS